MDGMNTMISTTIKGGLRIAWLASVIALACATAATASEDNTLQLNEALGELQASDAAWQNNDRTFRVMREANQSSAQDVEEFAGFVAVLRRQMLEDCQRFRDLGGEPTQYGLDCGLEPGQTPPALAAAIPDATGVQTEEEKFQALENELRAVEIELDNLFLQQREQLQSRSRPQTPDSTFRGSPESRTGASAAEQRKQGSGPQAGPGASAAEQRKQGSGPQAGPGTSTAEQRKQGSGPQAGVGASAAEQRKQGSGSEAGATGQPGGASRTGRRIGERGAGMAGKDRVARSGRQANTASDIPTGDDDNVLARQLREAAEKESDPVLREKLWDEYKKYKNATR